MYTYKNIEDGVAELSRRFKIWENKHPNQHNLILIAGPAGSGKSTFAKMIADNNTLILALDRYYLGAERQKKEQGIVNFSVPEALDWKRIKDDLEKLLIAKTDEPVMVPVYSMHESKCISEEKVLSKPRILIEGVYALYIKQETPFKIYIKTSDKLLLERRLERDMIERGISKEVIISRFNEHVLPAIKKFVKAQKEIATFIVNNDVGKVTFQKLRKMRYIGDTLVLPDDLQISTQ